MKSRFLEHLNIQYVTTQTMVIFRCISIFYVHHQWDVSLGLCSSVLAAFCGWQTFVLHVKCLIYLVWSAADTFGNKEYHVLHSPSSGSAGLTWTLLTDSAALKWAVRATATLLTTTSWRAPAGWNTRWSWPTRAGGRLGAARAPTEDSVNLEVESCEIYEVLSLHRDYPYRTTPCLSLCFRPRRLCVQLLRRLIKKPAAEPGLEQPAGDRRASAFSLRCLQAVPQREHGPAPRTGWSAWRPWLQQQPTASGIQAWFHR